MVKNFLHVSVLVEDTRRALDFYQGVLGLEVSPDRPDLGFPGVWLKVGGFELHVMELPNPDPLEGRPEHGGRDRHIAFAVDDIGLIKDKLDEVGITYTSSRSGRKAVFCRDPDGNALEFSQQ